MSKLNFNVDISSTSTMSDVSRLAEQLVVDVDQQLKYRMYRDRVADLAIKGDPVAASMSKGYDTILRNYQTMMDVTVRRLADYLSVRETLKEEGFYETYPLPELYVVGYQLVFILRESQFEYCIQDVASGQVLVSHRLDI